MEIRSVSTAQTYTTKDGKEKKRWYRIGTAFIHEDGEKINLDLGALPVSGKLYLFKIDEEKPGQSDDSGVPF